MKRSLRPFDDPRLCLSNCERSTFTNVACGARCLNLSRLSARSRMYVLAHVKHVEARSHVSYTSLANINVFLNIPNTKWNYTDFLYFTILNAFITHVRTTFRFSFIVIKINVRIKPTAQAVAITIRSLRLLVSFSIFRTQIARNSAVNKN